METVAAFDLFTPFRRLRRTSAYIRRDLASLLSAALLLTALLFAGPALATVELRVEAKPISDPIQTFVIVTDANSDPVGGLTAGDFTVTLDGIPIILRAEDLTLPPSQDPNQHVSVVFVMDYSGSVQNIALAAMQTAVVDFINAMSLGDYAAIIKFNDTNPDKASVVQPFTQIDGGSGTSMLISAVMAPYPGKGTNLLDAIELAIDQFAPPVSLPVGPKAIIVVTDGGDNESTTTQSTVVAGANGNSLPIFTIGVGDVAGVDGLDLLTNLAAQTGGDYLPAPTDAEIQEAYAEVSALLNGEYLLTIPSAISDCGIHTIIVTVAGQAAPASTTFTRCDTTPNPFSFTNQTRVNPGATVTSNAVTISGIDGPAAINVVNGKYSIGCGATFTPNAGTITNGQTVCVQHAASSAFDTVQETKLTVGGVFGTFTSTTKAAPPPSSGGGGAMGVMELLAGLVALAIRRRRQA